MFTELLPVLQDTIVTLTISRIDDQLLRVNVIPTRKTGKESSAENGLSTPLTVTATPSELDREFARQLLSFSGSYHNDGKAAPGGKPVFGSKGQSATAPTTQSLFDTPAGETKGVPAKREAGVAAVVEQGEPESGTSTADGEPLTPPPPLAVQVLRRPAHRRILLRPTFATFASVQSCPLRSGIPLCRFQLTHPQRIVKQRADSSRPSEVA
jgi:PRTRC genetic system protein E